jgi:hypothetical protein
MLAPVVSVLIVTDTAPELRSVPSGGDIVGITTFAHPTTKKAKPIIARVMSDRTRNLDFIDDASLPSDIE